MFPLLAKENQHLLAQKSASHSFALEWETIEVHNKMHHQNAAAPFQERAEVMKLDCVHFQRELSILLQNL